MKKSVIVTALVSLGMDVLPGDAAAEADAVLAQQVITATKSDKDISESPASVSVITSEALEARNAHRLDETLTSQVGVYVKGAPDHAPGDDSGTTVYMRGIQGLGKTAVLLDGQSINGPFSGGINWSGIMLEDIDRIEIVRGPFSALYGGGAIAGVINVLTKAPEKREAQFTAGVGSNDLTSASVLYRNKFDRLGIALGLSQQRSDGFDSERFVKTANNGVGATPVSGWQKTQTKTGDPAYLLGTKGDRWWWRDNADLNLYYDLDGASKLSLRTSWNRQETGFSKANSFLRDAAGNAVTAGSIGISDGGAKKITIAATDFLLGPNGAENTKINLGYETRLANKVTVKADVGYMDMGYWYVSQLAGATAAGGPGKLVDIPNDRSYGSLQASFPVLENHLLTVGASTSKEKVRKREYNLAQWQNETAAGSVRYSVDGENINTGVFVQDEYFIRDGLTLYLGGRYDMWSTEGSDSQVVAPVVAHRYGRRTDAALSPKVSVVYLPEKSTTLRASVGSAFRGPSLSSLYSSFSTFKSNPALKPERTKSWEIGFEHRWAEETTFSATYYENRLTDLIYTASLSGDPEGFTSTQVNAGKAVIKGFEFEIRKALLPGVSAFGNLTLNDAKIVENSAVPGSVGKYVTYTPKVMANAGLDVRQGAWTASIAGRYVGPVYTTDINNDTVHGVYGAYDAYTIWNAKVLYHVSKDFSVSLAVDNLTDRTYYQNYLAAGRTLFAELRMKF